MAWTAFVAFWTAVITLLAVGWLAPAEREPAPAVNEGDAGGTAERVISREELAAHGSEDDCWMAIRGVVYDLTAYIPEHPTSPDIMVEWCGKEATEAYETKGYGAPHSPRADALLEDYRIGVLAEGE